MIKEIVLHLGGITVFDHVEKTPGGKVLDMACVTCKSLGGLAVVSVHKGEVTATARSKDYNIALVRVYDRLSKKIKASEEKAARGIAA